MAPVQEPTLSAYGLTTDSLTRWNRWEHETMPRWAMRVWGATAVAFFLIGYDEGGLAVALVYAVAMGFGIGAFGSIFFGLAVEAIAKAIFPEAAGVARYQRACKDYARYRRETEAQYWWSLTGLQFEHALGAALRQAGYEARVTQASGDEGVDIVIRKDDRLGVVQCKATRTQVGPAVARELLGTLTASGADYAVLATTAGVTQATNTFITGKPIYVLSIDDCIALRRGEDALARRERMQALFVAR